MEKIKDFPPEIIKIANGLPYIRDDKTAGNFNNDYSSIAQQAILPVRQKDLEKLVGTYASLTPKAIYEMVAELGCRKYFHFGGFQATNELIQMLPLDKSKAVLEVGCASGKRLVISPRPLGAGLSGSICYLECSAEPGNAPSERVLRTWLQSGLAMSRNCFWMTMSSML